MEFHPNNPIVQICLEAQNLENSGDLTSALQLLNNHFDLIDNDFDAYLLAYFIARLETSVEVKLLWFERCLNFAQKVNSRVTRSAYSSIYKQMSVLYKSLKQMDDSFEMDLKSKEFKNVSDDDGPFYHGTKANLQVGDELTPGFRSNYHSEVVMNHIYFTAVINGASFAAELAKGDTEPRVYIVQPLGDFENDPNVTDKKFPGNPTRSYRSLKPIKIVGEITHWEKMNPEILHEWKNKLSKFSKEDIIN